MWYKQYQIFKPKNNCFLQVFEWPTDQWTDVRMVSAEIVMEERVEQWVHNVIIILPFSLLCQGQITHCWISCGTVYGSSRKLKGMTGLYVTRWPLLGKNVRFWFAVNSSIKQTVFECAYVWRPMYLWQFATLRNLKFEIHLRTYFLDTWLFTCSKFCAPNNMNWMQNPNLITFAVISEIF